MEGMNGWLYELQLNSLSNKEGQKQLPQQY